MLKKYGYYKDTTWIDDDYTQWRKVTYNYLLSSLPGLSKSELSDRIDGAALWTSFAEKIKVSTPLLDQIAKELNSSIVNQSMLPYMCRYSSQSTQLTYRCRFQDTYMIIQDHFHQSSHLSSNGSNAYSRAMQPTL
jgi:hypothetical protein